MMRRARALRIIRAVYLAALAAVAAWLVWSRRTDLAALLATAQPAWLGVALLLGFGQLVLSAAFWASAAAALGSAPGLRAALDATARSVLARYVPGSVWYALGRIALLRAAGVPTGVLATVAALESTLSLVVVLTLGAVLLLVGGRLPGAGLGLTAAIAALAVVSSPPVLNRLLAFLAARRGATVAALSWASWLRLAGLMLSFWCWSALTFNVYLRAFPALQPGSVAVVAGSFLVAWGIGFLAVFAPQGAGVFEAVVAGMLAGPGAAVGGVAVVVAGYRALIAVRDVVAAALAALTSRTRAPARGSSPSARA